MHTPSESPRGLFAPRLLCILCAAALTLSCARNRPELQHTVDSPEALAGAVLDGIAREDRPFLERLALSEEEFRDLVWPELPAARPERNMPWDYVWKDLHQKSQTSLSGILAQHGGRRYTIVDVKYRGDTTKYATFEVRRAAELVIKTESGEALSVRLFGSMISRGGKFKLFSYVVD